MYNEDGSHPSALGTYIAALTLFSTLFNVSADKVAYEFGLDDSAWNKVWRAVDKAVSGEMKIPERYLV